LLAVFSFSISVCSSQQLPINIDFESGTFTNWTGATGQCCPVYTPQPGIDTNQHVITSGTFTDPHSNGIINVVAPGSLFSARLGNDSGSAESEILDYTFTVPADSLLLILRFAVILENANHPPVKQPRFGYEITGTSPLLEGCLAEQVVAGDAGYDFVNLGTYQLLEWQTRVVNLTGQQGATITIHFETGDCEPGGHFGYAYVDCDLKEAKISGIYCNPDASVTLIAPPGLDGTWFDGSTNDSIQIAAPLQGSIYSFDIAHEEGCTVTLSKNLDAELPVAHFSYVTGCDFETTFQNNSMFQTGSTYNWEFGDGQSGILLHPAHDYNASGTYVVALTVTQPDFCSAVYSESITLFDSPVADFTYDGNCILQPVKLTNTSSSINNLTYEWFIDNQPSYNISSPEPIFYQPGTHLILLVATDLNNCSDTSIAEILIDDFTDCESFAAGPWVPNAFTPNGDGKNDYFAAIAYPASDNLPFTIYDRYGEIVYTGLHWDGNKNNNAAPAGIYSYRIKDTGQGRKEISYGTVLLLR